MPQFRLNLITQLKKHGAHNEVHEDTCHKRPEKQFEALGPFDHCKGAVEKAQRLHEEMKVDGCAICAPDCDSDRK